ncbi:MAG: hypothetical protein LBS35_03135 [Synergistaceae bacterium]|nr:hypothetical protein [Synergistaceae bacterium]
MGKIFIALLCVALAASCARAGEEFLADPAMEPSKFRGLEWRRSLSSVPDMVELYRDDDGRSITCSRKNDDLSFGDAALSSIEYIFIDGKLSRISLVAKGKKNEDALLGEAAAMFGRATVQSGEDYLWRFTNVSVMFSREPNEQSVLFYKYIGFLNK